MVRRQKRTDAEVGSHGAFVIARHQNDATTRTGRWEFVVGQLVEQHWLEHDAGFANRVNKTSTGKVIGNSTNESSFPPKRGNSRHGVCGRTTRDLDGV